MFIVGTAAVSAIIRKFFEKVKSIAPLTNSTQLRDHLNTFVFVCVRVFVCSFERSPFRVSSNVLTWATLGES